MFFSLFLLSIYPKAQLPFRLFSSQTMEIFSNNDNNIHFMNGKEEENKTVIGDELPIFSSKNISGLDERHIYNFTDNSEILNKIEINMHKFSLLRFLQNKSVTLMEKLKEIEFMERQEQNSMIQDVMQGGLFQDWDSDII